MVTVGIPIVPWIERTTLMTWSSVVAKSQTIGRLGMTVLPRLTVCLSDHPIKSPLIQLLGGVTCASCTCGC
jgi:hypothetical protein